jgi:WD40 repeat protein
MLWSMQVEDDYSVEAMALSPDGKLVATVDSARGPRVWDWQKGRQIVALHDDSDRAVAFSPDGCLIATGNYNSWARVWAPPLPGCRR